MVHYRVAFTRFLNLLKDRLAEQCVADMCTSRRLHYFCLSIFLDSLGSMDSVINLIVWWNVFFVFLLFDLDLDWISKVV
jgi:hypothetical protein